MYIPNREYPTQNILYTFSIPKAIILIFIYIVIVFMKHKIRNLYSTNSIKL